LIKWGDVYAFRQVRFCLKKSLSVLLMLRTKKLPLLVTPNKTLAKIFQYSCLITRLNFKIKLKNKLFKKYFKL
jgi:hypothetical protein